MAKLEIGPGRKRLGSDWKGLSIKPGPAVDYVWDILDPLPFPDGEFEIIYMSHVLEHVPWFNTVDVLKDIRRCLTKDGTLEVWVPDFRKLVRGYLDNEIPIEDKWRKYNDQDDYMVWLNGRIFTYGPGEENWHRAVFDQPYLAQCLSDAGFSEVFMLDSPRGVSHGYINLGVGAVK